MPSDPPRLAAALFAATLLAGCQSEQAWVFQNGVELGDAPPDTLLVEIFSGDDCGFACQPPGDRIYCQVIEARERGPAPSGLVPPRQRQLPPLLRRQRAGSDRRASRHAPSAHAGGGEQRPERRGRRHGRHAHLRDLRRRDARVLGW